LYGSRRADRLKTWLAIVRGDELNKEQILIHIPSIAAVIAVVAGAAMVFFGRRGAKA
jgi:hypothetical protein